MARLALYILIGYAVVTIFVFLWQRRLLYYPDQYSPRQDQLKALELRRWPTGGSNFRGYVTGHSTGSSEGTVVVFHGNVGAAWNRDYYVTALSSLGYHVVLVEYPGYGGRPGCVSEETLVADAKDAIRLVLNEFGGPVFLVGESLGCGVATGVAADAMIPVEGIALFTPWDTLPNLAQTIYWFLPARWLVKDKYDNVRNLSAYSGRTAVILADEDEIIPKRRGLLLYGSLRSEKRLWVVDNAGHNTWMETMDVSWWREITDFLSQGSRRKTERSG